MSASSEAVRRAIREMVIKHAPSPVEPVTRDTRLAIDLAYKAQDLLDAIYALEETLGTEFPDDGTVTEVRTVGDIEDYLTRILRER